MQFLWRKKNLCEIIKKFTSSSKCIVFWSHLKVIWLFTRFTKGFFFLTTIDRKVITFGPKIDFNLVKCVILHDATAKKKNETNHPISSFSHSKLITKRQNHIQIRLTLNKLCELCLFLNIYCVRWQIDSEKNDDIFFLFAVVFNTHNHTQHKIYFFYRFWPVNNELEFILRCSNNLKLIQ